MLEFVVVIFFLHLVVYRFFKINLINIYTIFFFLILILIIINFIDNKNYDYSYLDFANFFLFLILFRFIWLGIPNVSPTIYILYRIMSKDGIKELKFFFLNHGFVKRRIRLNIENKIIHSKKKIFYISTKGLIILKFIKLVSKIYNVRN